MEEQYLYVGESMGTNFPSFPNSVDLAAFSYAVGNWWGNPCIFQVMKYTTEWETNNKHIVESVSEPIYQAFLIR